MGVRLLSKKGVGEMLDLEMSTVEYYVLDPSFPSAVRLPNGRGGYGHPKWLESDIEKWVLSFKKSDQTLTK